MANAGEPLQEVKPRGDIDDANLRRRNRDHAATVRWFNIACDRRVVIQRQVRASAMIVIEVIVEDPSKVALVENNAIIEALATDRSDDSLDVR